jgi:hypothetical protein
MNPNSKPKIKAGTDTAVINLLVSFDCASNQARVVSF